MSVLAEVAARADVPVEGVIRVFTRRPVSRRIERRVVEVLDSLDPEQLRTVERLARAGAPNVVPIGSEITPTADRIAPALAASDPGTALIAAEGALVTGDDELMVELGRLLSDLAVGINEIRQYLVGARQDRVVDLALLVDLMTTGWQGVDRRLGRLEQMLTRLEAAQETPLAQLSAPPALERPIEVVIPPPPEVPAAAVEAIALPPPERPRRPRSKRLLAPAVPLLFVAVLLIALLASEFMDSSDDPRLQPAPEGSAPQDAQRRAAPQPSLSSTTGRPAIEAPPAATTTPPPPPTATTTPPPPAATSTARTTTSTTTAPGSRDGLTPSRVFAWPATAGSSYYLFRIYRGTKLIHEAQPATPRLVLPASVRFTKGTYRWSVRPGVGPRAENELGAPIVASRFEVGA